MTGNQLSPRRFLVSATAPVVLCIVMCLLSSCKKSDSNPGKGPNKTAAQLIRSLREMDVESLAKTSNKWLSGRNKPQNDFLQTDWKRVLAEGENLNIDWPNAEISEGPSNIDIVKLLVQSGGRHFEIWLKTQNALFQQK